MILAERTAEIASVASNRYNITSRKESVQRFLFDGIQRDGCDLPIVFRYDLSSDTGPGSAETSSPFFDITMSETYFADCHLTSSSELAYKQVLFASLESGAGNTWFHLITYA